MEQWISYLTQIHDNPLQSLTFSFCIKKEKQCIHLCNDNLIVMVLYHYQEKEKILLFIMVIWYHLLLAQLCCLVLIETYTTWRTFKVSTTWTSTLSSWNQGPAFLKCQLFKLLPSSLKNQGRNWLRRNNKTQIRKYMIYNTTCQYILFSTGPTSSTSTLSPLQLFEIKVLPGNEEI